VRARSQTRLQLFVRDTLVDELLGAEYDGECDPIGILGAGFGGRYRDWDRGPLTGGSQDHIWVSEVTAAPAG
jgi:hypothetical protein